MTVPADILLVIATLVTGLALASMVSSWADRVLSVPALTSLLIGLCLFAFVHFTQEAGLVWRDIPDAFIAVAARILN
ncbi:hypothetical protein [Rhodophyticola sp.]|jgi:hypothetical protein|uniref:hypothetical protein n=1 Tax=Rhodophyticola sp. TaxID=2680032 RepID=UPI001B1BD090|nr:hypothetical protein [Roseicyclus sp.]MBO6623938.1 hypothetical protein [Roseicyclus sp.]MBO6923053.1 hypothetical protein [Roseicyclus sp.]